MVTKICELEDRTEEFTSTVKRFTGTAVEGRDENWNKLIRKLGDVHVIVVLEVENMQKSREDIFRH